MKELKEILIFLLKTLLAVLPVAYLLGEAFDWIQFEYLITSDDGIWWLATGYTVIIMPFCLFVGWYFHPSRPENNKPDLEIEDHLINRDSK